MTAACPEAYVDIARRCADAAGAVIRGHFRTPFKVETKADESPVTVADRGAERAIRDILDAELPDHGIIGEEYGIKPTDGPWTWILDPIDGTRGFVAGVPLFGTLIGLTHEGEAALGVLDQPILGERWLAHGDTASTLNDAPVAARDCGGIANAILMTTDTSYFEPGQVTAWERVTAACANVRYSADCYAFGLLASGHVDLCIEANVQVYDIAALVPIVENAGGLCTDWQGRPLDLTRMAQPGILAAATPALHAEAMALLAA